MPFEFYKSMRNLFKEFLRFGFLVLIAALVIIGGVSYGLKNKKSEKVYAGVGDNVTGYAWSENIGWISFNNTNTEGGTSYGVNVLDDSGIGKLSGYAWSENIGWISFNRADTVAPPNNDVGAPYNVLAYIDSNNKLQGWARALAACDSVPCTTSGAGINTGGWDGWIRFTKITAPAYSVAFNDASKTFEGFAWGSDVLGWISFNSINCDTDGDGDSDGGSGCPPSGTVMDPYMVSANFVINRAPSASNLGISNSSTAYCDKFLTFQWTFTDPDSSDTQSAYKIEASYDGVTYIILRSADSSVTSVSIPLSEISATLSGDWYSQSLYWKVTVTDNGAGTGTNKKSATTTASTFGPMPGREYPVVNFTTNPLQILANQDVQFLDSSICYISGDTPAASCSSWLWTIPGATYVSPSTFTFQNPTVNFSSSGSVNVSLQATDGGAPAYSCTLTKSINIGLPLPQIKEKK